MKFPWAIPTTWIIESFYLDRDKLFCVLKAESVFDYTLTVKSEDLRNSSPWIVAEIKHDNISANVSFMIPSLGHLRLNFATLLLDVEKKFTEQGVLEGSLSAAIRFE